MTRPQPVALARPRRPACEIVEALGIEALCEFVVGGKATRAIAADLGVSRNSVRSWIAADPERSRLYALARLEQADVLFEEILEIADEPVPMGEHGLDSAAVQNKRVRIDARKWIVSKLKPEVYGERLGIGVSGGLNVTRTPEQVEARLMFLLAKAGLLPSG